MSIKLVSGSLPFFSLSFSSPSHSKLTSSQMSLRRQCIPSKQYNMQHLAASTGGFIIRPRKFKHRVHRLTRLLQKTNCFPAISEDFFPEEVMDLSTSESEDLPVDIASQDDESVSPGDLAMDFEENGGKSGFLSFYNSRYVKESTIKPVSVKKNQKSFLWFAGPAVLVASFILPSLYLRRIISTIFEDSLLTDFLILFFTEALFYCGVAVFVLLIDHLWRPAKADPSAVADIQMGHRISSVTILMLSLMIPMVTMGFVWPWTGPAASAALAPYLVGIVVQFAFERYARYVKSPSWPVITVVFQVYRLHQLNRAAQLVTALSFTIRGAEMTSHNLAINSSLGTLLNVLQFLGLICIWSLSSFLMRYFPSSATMEP